MPPLTQAYLGGATLISFRSRPILIRAVIDFLAAGLAPFERGRSIDFPVSMRPVPPPIKT
jgi:hypothetical protein